MISMFRKAIETVVSRDRLVMELRRLDQSADDRQVSELASRLNKLIQTIPDALDAAFKIGEEPRFAKSARFATGQVLYYLLEESDLISSKDAGLLGIIDDAYLTHSSVNGLVNHYGPLMLPRLKYEHPIKEMQSARLFMPSGIAEALDATAARLIDLSSSLFGSPMEASKTSKRRGSSFRLSYSLDSRERAAGRRKLSVKMRK
jgi:hypothetical protein